VTQERLRTALWMVLALAVIVVFKIVIAATSTKFSTPLPVIVLGTIIGLTYGLLAVGLVLIYRTNRIINFAHGEVGAFAAAVFGLAVVKWHVPYYVGLPLALGLGGVVGALAEVVIIRRLRNAPRLMSIIATLGVGQFLILFGAIVNGSASAGSRYPIPPWLPVYNLGALRLTEAYVGMLIFAPILVAALALFLRYSRYGIGIRSAAANPEAARMAGIFAGRMSSLAWGLAGALSAFTAILVLPSRGFTSGASFGPSLLLRALAGAVVARVNSLPRAMVAGVGLGIIEQLLLWNYPRAGFVEVALFAVILVALFLQQRQTGRDEEKGSWAAVQAWRPIPHELRQLWLVRNLGKVVGVIVLALAIMLPAVASNSASINLISIMAFSIVGLSVGVITGLGGQLSLGQFAVAAIGATISWVVSSRTGNFPLALLYAGMGAAIASLLIGVPSLRVRGLMLTVTTLSFALVTPSWLLQQSWMLGTGANPGRPIVFHHPLNTGRAYYYFALTLLVLMYVLAWNVRRGGFGRLLIAIRDNEDNARAFTVRSSTVKIQAFLLAGFIAGIGGAVYGHTLSRIGYQTFPIGASIDVVAMVVIGGISILAGPILGAFYILGIPVFVHADQAALAASNLGWLLLILYLPGGIAQLLQPLRDRIVRTLGRRAGIRIVDDDAGETAGVDVGRLMPTRPRHAGLVPPGGVLLDAQYIRKRFGGLLAVDDVSIQVRAGETLGLIGPNGAGKTTLFEVLGGFNKPDGGHITFAGRDISNLGPEERGRRGLIRSFQDAALFPTMTVLDAVHLAMERVSPTSFTGSIFGFGGRERAKHARALELVHLMGLDFYRDKQIQELSTGTRRITELACLVALEPRLLLLDEPSSGIAQRETEALGGLLRDLKDQLQVTLVIIEHDIPLIMSLADRIVAMDAGRVIAEGPPDIVRTNAQVVEAYLGGSLAAIERSGVTASP
jgi:ABC-type branched-subunit amino acid transport system ATPase component/ABC-type branched-subunit amino acid transport system permease subunit